MKVSQKKTTTRKERSDNKRKTAAGYESMTSGALQHKVWRPGEQQQITTAIEQLTNKERLQNKVWGLGGINYPDLCPGGHKFSYLGSLMHDNSAQ